MRRFIKTMSMFLVFVIANLMMYCSKLPTSPSHLGEKGVSNNYSAEDNFYHEVAAEHQLELRVEAINSEIKIIQVSNSQTVEVSAVKRVKSFSVSDARLHLSNLDVLVQDLNDKILVKTIQPEDTRDRDYRVNYTITLPQNINLTLYNGNGDILLIDIYGNVVAEVGNGDIDGQVNLPLNGSIDMQVLNGSIELDIPQNTSASFTATVDVGTINLTNFNLSNRVQTNNSLQGTSGNGQGSINLTTERGNIQVAGF